MYIMGAPLVHDIYARCVVCAFVLISSMCLIFESSVGGWRRKLEVASWDGSWLRVTDDNVGLLLEQPRGPAPLSAPRALSGGCALI